MYLKQAFIENSGPLQAFNLVMPFTDSGLPKPLTLVGANGGGKTNFLSLVTDALFEAAAVHYNNVLPGQAGGGRSWFRIVGGATTRIGSTGSFSILQFSEDAADLIYREKGGIVDSAEAQQRLPDAMKASADWPLNGNAIKEFAIDDEKSRDVFAQGVYAYFPASRSEVPYWLNRDAINNEEFEMDGNFSKRLGKPIYVEHGLHLFKQWLLSVILESRSHIAIAGIEDGITKINLIGNWADIIVSERVLVKCNEVLQAIMDDDSVRFVWLGRKSTEKIGIARGGELAFPSLSGLSGGQSIILALFGTILRYADQSKPGFDLDISGTTGIVVIDEIDAHIHIDLQHRVLPRLIKMFPAIQFIMSSHSPIFVLGMERLYGPDSAYVIEMPSGVVVSAETYSEFGRALEVMAATSAFAERVMSEGVQPGKALIFVEGETDSPYLLKAAELFDRTSILHDCEIEWIGAKDSSGQGFNTGKGALDKTLAVLRANPALLNRRIMLLYDSDAKKANADYEKIFVRSVPTNPNNNKVKAGIENLLDESVFRSEDYKTTKRLKDNGDIDSHTSIRKADLCRRICSLGLQSDFLGFVPVLDLIEEFVKS
jgi:hypothetical protein